MKQVTVTRKIELNFHTEEDKERKEYHRQLFKWQSICQRGANKAISHMFVMSNQKDLVYLKEKAKDLLLNEKRTKAEIYKVVNADMKDWFDKSDKNGFYTLLSTMYVADKQIPSAVISALNSQMFDTYKRVELDVIMGKRSLATFRSDMPIPFPIANMRNIRKARLMRWKKKTDGIDPQTDLQERDYPAFAFSLFGIPFITRFGMDKSRNYEMFERAVSKELYPSWLLNLEPALNNAIMTTKDEFFDLVISEHEFKFMFVKYNKLAQPLLPENYYWKVDTMDGKEPLSFRMNRHSEVVRAEDGVILLDETGKKIKKDMWEIGSTYKFCDSSISLEKVKIQNKEGGTKMVNKVFLNAVFKFDKEPWELDENKTAFCELGIDIPITVSVGRKSFRIGNAGEMLYRRKAIQGAYYNAQKVESSRVKGGRGRAKKMKPIDRFHGYERKFVKGKVHFYSKKLVDFALQNGCKYIHLTNIQEAAKKTEDDKLLLRNWGYSGLADRIKEKAARFGIEVIDPRKEEKEENEPA